MEPGGLRHTAEAGDEVTEETPGSGRFGVGSRIAGYRLDEVTGRGGMAVVYRAYDTRLERPVALKLLAPELARDAAFRQRFIRESRTAAAVDHPNIIPIFEAGEADGVLFIAMRFVHGRDVQSLVNDGGPLPVVQACHIISQVAAGLEAAHAHGLVHRDVKPGNILLDGSASFPGHAYLSDFGLSKRALSDSALTSTGQFLGTVDYIAPEQIEGRPVDARTDEYALACTAFTMLTGAPPFTRDESVAVMWAQMSAPPPALTSRRPELPAAVNEVMAKALAKVPVERYATCPQFADALCRACGLEPGARGPGPQPTQLAGPEPAQVSGLAAGPARRGGPGPAVTSGYGRVRGAAGRAAASGYGGVRGAAGRAAASGHRGLRGAAGRASAAGRRKTSRRRAVRKTRSRQAGRITRVRPARPNTRPRPATTSRAGITSRHPRTRTTPACGGPTPRSPPPALMHFSGRPPRVCHPRPRRVGRAGPGRPRHVARGIPAPGGDPAGGAGRRRQAWPSARPRCSPPGRSS